MSPRLAIIPAQAVRDKSLAPMDIHVLALLGCHTDEAGWCYRNQSKMAEDLGVSRQTVNCSIGRLSMSGYLEKRDINAAAVEAGKRKKGMRSICVYRVNLNPNKGPSEGVIDAQTSDYLAENSDKTAEITLSSRGDNRCQAGATTVVKQGRQLNDSSSNDSIRTMKMPNKPEGAYSPSSSHREKAALKAKAKEIKASQKAANAERRSKAQPDLPDMPDDVNAAKEAERAFEDAVVHRFNAIAPKHKIAPVLRLTSQRRQTLRVLIKSGFDINAALDALERAAFPTKNGWTPENFDSVFREQTITQLLEGKFDSGKRQVVETADEMRWRHYMRTWIKYMNMPVAQRTNPATGVYLAWESDRGPEPFQPGCRVPDYILAEFQRPNSAPIVSFDDLNAKRWRQRIMAWIERGRVSWPESWGQMRDIPEEIRREFPNEIFDDEKPATITKNGGVK